MEKMFAVASGQTASSPATSSFSSSAGCTGTRRYSSSVKALGQWPMANIPRTQTAP